MKNICTMKNALNAYQKARRCKRYRPEVLEFEANREEYLGKAIRELESLQIGLNSEGAVSVKEFSSSLITAAHIIFRPGKTLADITKILSYQQVTTRAVAQTGGSGNEGEDDDKGSGGGSDGGGSGEAPDPAA